jgi:molybdenum cofactor cytidylyltransferase
VKFGPLPINEAIGAIVAHAVRSRAVVLKKGEIITATHAARLTEAGIDEVVVAQLEAGDIGEDSAAQRLAAAFAGANIRVQRPFTGRCNLFATCDGLLRVDSDALNEVNEADERLTIATLQPWRQVAADEMVATVKVIPFAVPDDLLVQVVARAAQCPLQVAAYSPLRVAVISTLLPGLKASVIEKTLRALEKRLAPARASIVVKLSVAHETTAVAEAITACAPQSDIVVIFGASAISDRRDVIPAALERSGGVIEQLGMPVDPGNLLLVGRLWQDQRKVHVLGAPGCARSPKENGFDWVLCRLLAGIEVTSRDIRHMGAGGLLTEIAHRGQLREGLAGEAED